MGMGIKTAVSSSIIFLMIGFVTALSPALSSAQTLHAMIFSDMKESEERGPDRAEEMKNVKDFCSRLAETVGYAKNIRTHSDNEFTSTQFLRDLETMSVGPEDVVIMVYNGHGCNWDDDDWPHMAFRDRQYWQTTAYDKMLEKCGDAKLMLCIACCCNMDSRGRAGYALEYDYDFDPNKTRQLLAGFPGKKKVMTSSSVRGQYSYSWVKGPNWRPGSKVGSIYGISLREAVAEVLSAKSNLKPTWENVFEIARKKTLDYTNQKQLAQFKIKNETKPLSAGALRLKNAMRRSSAPSGPVAAKVSAVNLSKNLTVGDVPSLVIGVDFNIDNLSNDGGRAVAFLESPKGAGVKDTNGRFCTSNGKVAVGKDFGTRRASSSFKDFQLVIPMDELHIPDPSKPHYIRVGIYDYASKKYIAWSDYAVF